MIIVDVPDFGRLELRHLVLDYNGTIAVDGTLLPGVTERLHNLGNKIKIHVLTADTFDSVKQNLQEVECTVHVLPQEKQDDGKLHYVKNLGTVSTVSIGNGRNDAKMLKTSALGIGVIQQEGSASGTLMSSDVVTTSIADALDLLIHPLRLVATLRS